MPRLARRTRLRLATEATCAHLHKLQPSELDSKLDLKPIETQPGELNLTRQQQQQQTEEEPRYEANQSSQKEDGEKEGPFNLGEIAEANLKAQSFERLRQTGKFLREISDEFAK